MRKDNPIVYESTLLEGIWLRFDQMVFSSTWVQPQSQLWLCSKTPTDQILTKFLQVKLNPQLLYCLFSFLAFILHSLLSLVLQLKKTQKMSLSQFHVYGHILMEILGSDSWDRSQLLIAALMCANMIPLRMNCKENTFPALSPPMFNL